MTVNQVIKHFGSLYQAAKQCGYSFPNAYHWKRNQRIPIKSQLKIQKVTNNVLIADIKDSI